MFIPISDYSFFSNQIESVAKRFVMASIHRHFCLQFGEYSQGDIIEQFHDKGWNVDELIHTFGRDVNSQIELINI